MPYGLYVSAEGVHAQSRRLEVIANNPANVDTVGFKRELAVPQTVPPARRAVASGYLEESAVRPISEMTEMIHASRALEANVNMMKTQDEMLGGLVNRVMSVQTLYTAATGMSAMETKLDVIANNLATVETTAFKKGRANFEDLLYRHEKMPGAQDAAGQYTPKRTSQLPRFPGAQTVELFPGR